MRSLSPDLNYLTAGACLAFLAALSACGDRRMSPTSPTLVAPAFSHAHHGAVVGDRVSPLDHLPGHVGLSVLPNYGSALGGDLVTITGTGFVPGATVMFGLTPAMTVTVVNDTTITATSPAGLEGWVDIVVTNPSGQAFTLAGGFIYPLDQTVTGVTTVTFTPTGPMPRAIQIMAGSSVTIVNNDLVPHDMRSNPHPFHWDCPELNQIGFLAAGASGTSAPFMAAATCGFHDHNDPENQNVWARVVIVPTPALPPQAPGEGPAPAPYPDNSYGYRVR